MPKKTEAEAKFDAETAAMVKKYGPPKNLPDPGIRPIHENVLIVRDPEDKTSGGIIIPDTAQKASQFGTVVAAGSGYIFYTGIVRPMAVKRGDRVVFSKYAGQLREVDGQEYLQLKEDDIFGIVLSPTTS